MHLWADSYNVDWRRGTARFEHPRLVTQDGRLIASAGLIEADGISIPMLGGVSVRVRDLKGTVTRLASGRFDIEGFLPKPSGTPSKIPYVVVVNRADVALVDLRGKTPFRREAIARDTEVRGVADRWLAQSDVEIPDIGHLRADLQHTPGNGLLMQGMTAGLQLTSVLDHLQTTPDVDKLAFLKGLRTGSVEAYGPISVFLSDRDSLSFDAKVRIIGRDIRFREYAVSRFRFDGSISETSLRGVAEAQDGGTKARFDGSLNWKGDVSLGGMLSADSPSRAGLPIWVRRIIPEQIKFDQGRLTGWLEYQRGTGVRLAGPFKATQLTAYGQTVNSPSLALYADRHKVRIAVDQGRWANAEVRGAVLLGTNPDTLTGGLATESADLASVAKAFGAHGLSGTAHVNILLGGTRAAPTAVLQARGTGAYRVNDRLVSGQFAMAGTYAANLVKLDRFRVETDAGDARVIGSLSFKKKSLALKIDANNVRLEKLREDLLGKLNGSGIVDGSFDHPRFRGAALALDVLAAGQRIPFVSGDLIADKDRISATNVRIVRGAGEVDGELAVDLRTRGLEGSLSAKKLLLNEYVTSVEALGSIQVDKLSIGGTLDEPKAEGTAFGENLVLGGILVDRADLRGSMLGTRLEFDTRAKIGGGTLAGAGDFDFARKSGSLKLAGQDLALERITPFEKTLANVTGTINGGISAWLSPLGLWGVRADGKLEGVSLNSAQLGRGEWSFSSNGDLGFWVGVRPLEPSGWYSLGGSASTGALDRFLQIEELRYDSLTDSYKANVSLMDAAIPDIYTTIRPFFTEFPEEVQRALADTGGSLTATVRFSGPILQPNVDLSFDDRALKFDIAFFEASDLSYHGQPLGTLDTKFSGNYQPSRTFLDIDKVNWTGLQGTLVVTKGFIDTTGDLYIDGDLSNFDFSYLGILNADWAKLSGKATLSASAVGKTASPVIRASFETSKGSELKLSSSGQSFSLVLNTIDVREPVYSGREFTGGIEANGLFFYRGFTGKAYAHIPFDYPRRGHRLGIPDGFPIQASISFDNIDVKNLKQFADYLDAARSSGNLTGQISIVGPRENLALQGFVNGQLKSVAFLLPGTGPEDTTALDTLLTGVALDVKLRNNQIVMTIDAEGSDGGTLKGNLSTTFLDMQKSIDQLIRGDTDSLFGNEVRGDISANNFVVNQRKSDRNYGSFDTTLNFGSLKITGPIKEPTVSGTVLLSNTRLMPAESSPKLDEESKSGTGRATSPPPINPQFNVGLVLTDPMSFSSRSSIPLFAGALDMSLTGSGLLGGSFANPEMSATLTLKGGRLDLPAARVSFEEGGSLRMYYSPIRGALGRAGQGTLEAADVSIVGRTSITLLRYGDTVQHYDIRLIITGDILNRGGLNIDAVSDPPELGRDEILGLLGDTDVLKSLGGGTSQSETEKRIRNAIVSMAVPQLTEAVTTQLAAGLKLEYLTVDYNALEGASLDFAKVLGKGVILQGRRQISPPIGLRKPDYDLRLTYRLPTRNVALSRVVFSLGLDQDRPYKLGITYGFRF